MKTLFAALAGAALIAAPLAASAQQGGWQGRNGGGGYAGRGGTGGQSQANPAPAQVQPQPQAQVPQGQGRNVGRNGNGGQADRGQSYGQNRYQGQRDYGRSNDRNNYRSNDRNWSGGYDRGGYANRDYGRQTFRGGYGGGRSYNWHSGRSTRWFVGSLLPRSYWNSFIDPFAYGLDRAPYGYHWVVLNDEALLIEDYSGRIVDVLVL